MKKQFESYSYVRVFSCIGGSLALATTLLWLSLGRLQAEPVFVTSADEFGYGFNVAAWDLDRLQNMGFNWVKVFNGPGRRLPINVLLRVDANSTHFNNLSDFGDSVTALAQSQKGFVDAYEIGNEPNLDASYGWTTSPNAADYVALLCEAYGRIKAIDPAARVISAGLAPTGRVNGNWNGHPGHNSLYQDEREFFKEFIVAGGGNCLDGVGYHPYGFSADFDAEPDVNLGTPDSNCSNGFCFRGVEKIYEIMAANGLGSKTIWTTEYGWIVEPPASCMISQDWQNREWQIVSEQKQADNLVGSFQYATTNWPWMEAMFVFNLNFNKAGNYDECEQMRFYAVQDRPAESALRDMPKEVIPEVGELMVSPGEIGLMITPANQPYTLSVPIVLENVGTAVFTYTVSLDPGSLVPTVINSGNSISPSETDFISVTIASSGKPTGVYTASLTIEATPETIGTPMNIPVNLFIVDQIYQAYVPLVERQ